LSELVTITSGDLTARIHPLGAELHSLTDAAGREYMTDADPAYWTGHAPILFPIVGELRGGTYRLDGREYALPRHGFARRSRFELIEHRGHIARFRLSDSAETRAVYPFAFALELSFRLHGTRLEVEALVRNTGREPLPFNLGFHPAFAWPLPDGGDKLAHAILFEHEELADLRGLDDKGLLAGRTSSPLRGDTLALTPELFANDALVWDALESQSVTYRGAGATPALHVAFPDTSYLGVWQKPGADFICIEPWQGLADEAVFEGDFAEKAGLVTLSPGTTRSFRLDVTVRPAEEPQP
jgi:galactose mutarotase-like enzyme